MGAPVSLTPTGQRLSSPRTVWAGRRSSSPPRHHLPHTVSHNHCLAHHWRASADTGRRSGHLRRWSRRCSSPLCPRHMVGSDGDSNISSRVDPGPPDIQHGLVELCESRPGLPRQAATCSPSPHAHPPQTFPLASLAICTARLAIELDSLTLKIVYTIFALLNFLLWVFVAIPTAKGFFSGALLVAPCIADLPLDPMKPVK